MSRFILKMEMGFRLVTKMSTVEINQTIQALVCRFFFEPEIESQTQQSSFLHFQIVAAHPFPCSGFGAKICFETYKSRLKSLK